MEMREEEFLEGIYHPFCGEDEEGQKEKETGRPAYLHLWCCAEFKQVDE